MEPRARASIVILSSLLSGADIAGRVGMRGDKVWERGEPVGPKSKTRQKFSGWSITSRTERTEPAGKHVRDILERAEPVWANLVDLQQSGLVESLRFWVHLDSPTVGLSFEATDLHRIAEIGSLEIDIYS